MPPSAVPPEAPPGVTVHHDVVHGQEVGYRPLALDLYLPPGEPRAVAVFVHGGGWHVGSRRDGPGPVGPSSSRLFLRAAQRGLAVASVDYRLSGEAVFPAQLDDVAAACTFLDASRDRFGLGAAPLTLWGVSSGGHLAALRALDAAAQPPAAACAVWYPITDIASMPPDELTPSRLHQLLGSEPAEVPDRARRASPTAQVHASAPPFLILHGAVDNLVPVDQSVRLHEALLGVGAASTLELVDGQSHMFMSLGDTEVEALVDRTVDFLIDSATGA